MDPFTSIFTWQFVIISLAIAGITYPVRLFAGFFAKTPRILQFWNDVALPTIPIIIGPTLTLAAVSFPFPNDLSIASSRMIWGVVAGMFSSVVYRLTKAAIKTFFGELTVEQPVKDPAPNKPAADPSICKHHGKKPKKKHKKHS
jgi:hypothetical protein